MGKPSDLPEYEDTPRAETEPAFAEVDEDDEEEDLGPYEEAVEGFVWLVGDKEGFLLTGNENFRDEIDGAETDNLADFEIEAAWSGQRQRGLWFLEGTLRWSDEDKSEVPEWRDISLRRPSHEDFARYRTQLTFEV